MQRTYFQITNIFMLFLDKLLSVDECPLFTCRLTHDRKERCSMAPCMCCTHQKEEMIRYDSEGTHCPFPGGSRKRAEADSEVRRGTDDDEMKEFSQERYGKKKQVQPSL